MKFTDPASAAGRAASTSLATAVTMPAIDLRRDEAIPMPNESDRHPPTPPPLPPSILSYQTPGSASRESRQMENLVTGVNLRLVDNLSQLAAGAVLAGIGAIIGLWRFAAPGAVAGGILGFIAGIFLAGAVIGIVRAIRRR